MLSMTIYAHNIWHSATDKPTGCNRIHPTQWPPCYNMRRKKTVTQQYLSPICDFCFV